MKVYYEAIVDCREGWRLISDTEGTYYEPRYLPCTLARYETLEEAQEKALEVCTASPKDAINPRVREIIR